jgi:hypothetical protein
VNLRYYEGIDDSDLFNDYNGESGYLLFQPWPCGLNNVRQGLELAVCISYLTNRTLVLPEYFTFWLIGRKRFFDFYSITGVKYELLDDFIGRNNFNRWRINDEHFSLNRDEIPREIHIVKTADNLIDEIHDCVIYEESPPPDNKFIRNRRLIKLSNLIPEDQKIVYFHQNLFGIYYQILYTFRQQSLKKLIAKHVRPSDACFDEAERLINLMGDRSYYSMHIRRYDFQYKETLISPGEIIERICSEIPLGSKLYIATDFKYNMENPLSSKSKHQDATDSNFFDEFLQKYDVTFMKDLVESETDITPVVEQLLCTRGIKFYNQHPSTFSCYIFRMRGIMGDVDSKYYDIIYGYNENLQRGFLEHMGSWTSWSREFKDAWEF